MIILVSRDQISPDCECSLALISVGITMKIECLKCLFILNIVDLDLSKQQRYLPPKVEIHFNILCNDSRLLLLSKDNAEYIVKIRNAHLNLTRIALFPNITETFLSVFQKDNCQYFLQGSYFNS